MKIGELAQATGTNAETIRYYERIALLPPPARTNSNYRDYGPDHAERLRFVRHARSLGFDIADVRSLLDLADQPDRDCAEADRIASGHLATVERKIAQLQQLERELRRMLVDCGGGRIASCHIMQSLADHQLCEEDRP